MKLAGVRQKDAESAAIAFVSFVIVLVCLLAADVAGTYIDTAFFGR